MTKFKQFERYPTRNGGEALILTEPHRHTGDGIVAAHYDASGEWKGTRTHYGNGSVMGSIGHACNTRFDILPPEPETREVWVNVAGYPGDAMGMAGWYGTREVADRHAHTNRVGCHRITLRAEFEEDE